MLREAAGWGMSLRFVSRAEFRRLRADSGDLRQPGRMIIPEGGDNWPGLLGLAALGMSPDLAWHQYSHVVLAVGTGCTFAGLRLGLPPAVQLLGVSALKGDWVQAAMGQRLQQMGVSERPWAVSGAYHRGGFGRVDPALLSFITEFEDNTGLLLDPVYTGKAMMALQAFSANGYFPRGSQVLFIHSGGLQGRRGFNLDE
jgi:1-aminocyclopropane-1-carboxylate deaminase